MKHMFSVPNLTREDWSPAARMCLVLLLLSLCVDPLCAQGTMTTGGTSVMPSGSQALPAFTRLWMNLQGFSLVGLAIGLIIGGLAWVFGKPTIAMGVFIGAFVMFGGPYVVGLIHDSLVGTY